MNQKELLKGLTGKGISLNVRELAQFTADSGVLVTPHCGRRRSRISLPEKLLGLCPDKWKESNQDFFFGHVSLGQLTLIPKEMDAKLNRLDTKLRRLVQDCSVNGSYVPLAMYSELVEEFSDIEKEFERTVDEIAQEWNHYREEFINGTREFVESRGKRTILKRDRDRLVSNVIASIPTEQQFRDSAYMHLDVRAFPTTGVTTEGLDPDLEDALNRTWRNDVVSNAVKCIEMNIGLVFAQTCTISQLFVNTGKVDTRSVNALIRVATRVRKLNVFANPLLEQLGDRLSNISELTDEQLAEVAEDAILDTYEYAKATGIKLDLKKCQFTKTQLDDMLEVRRKFAAV